MPQASAIPQRPFGRHSDVKIAVLALGGHHIGQAQDEATAIAIMNQAIDGGINFFDNCWEYHRGKSENWMGKVVKDRRKELFLMSKVCTHGRDKNLALKMLEQSLRRLQTDHLDLWQVHGASFDNDADLFIRPDGAAEALAKAKEQGKVRFTGFTGHKDPAIHLKMLGTGFPFDAVQMPLNPFDATFKSFRQQVLPELNRRGIAALGMKPLSGTGAGITMGVLTAEEALRFAMSLPVVTTITGMERMDVVRQNLSIARGFQPFTDAEMEAIAERVRPVAADGRFELYKMSLKFDNPEARMAHDFPLDMQSVEVKEMVNATDNTGDPFPKVTP
jgi:aryl-alcohol dehydrogenase-like predicted oxidoreductase